MERKRIIGTSIRVLLISAVLFLLMAMPAGAAGQGEGSPSAADRGEDGFDPDRPVPGYFYTVHEIAEVDGRQGVAWEDGEYWISGNQTLSRYDADWNQVRLNSSPLLNFAEPLDHIADIDVYNGEVFACAERFNGTSGEFIHIVVYDAETLELRRVIPFCEWCGQREASGIAADPDSGSLWLTSWSNDWGSQFLYRYDLASDQYIGRIQMQPAPRRIQGVAYYDGFLYLTADDGAASRGEPDHLYRWRVDTEASVAEVTLERSFWDVPAQGEMEGISFDRDAGRMLVSCNYRSEPDEEGKTRECRIVLIYDMDRPVYPLDLS